MDHFDRSVFRELTDKTDDTFISIYMPTTKSGQDTRQNTIRLRNLLRAAQNSCLESGVRRTDVDGMLEPADALLDNSEFWQHQEAGLAIFAGRGFFRAFRLPIAFRELVVTADRLHVKPLLEMFSRDGRFFVLAISLHRIRLLSCTQHSADEIEIGDVPRTFEEFMRFVDQERQVQFHTRTQPRFGDRAAVFHAVGSESDNAIHKKNVQDFVRLIVQSIDSRLADQSSPLVLAGAEFLRATFREMSDYREIAEEGISGSPDRLSDSQLRQRAWSIVQPRFAAATDEAVRVYSNANGTPMSSDELEEIVRSAYQGRIGILFVSLSNERWGRYDAAANEVVQHDRREPGDVDLLDFAAAHTLLHRGQVYVVPTGPAGDPDQPEPSPVSGILDERPAAAVFRMPGVFVQARSAE